MSLKQRYFDLAVRSLQNVLRPAPQGYICPLCLEVFTELEQLSLEHAPPKYLGGKKLCLTCVRCNATAGHSLEGPLHWEARVRGFMSLDREPEPAQMLVGDTILNVTVTRDSKGVAIVVPPGRNAPGAGERAKESFRTAFSEG